jgi:hypothetical protein
MTIRKYITLSATFLLLTSGALAQPAGYTVFDNSHVHFTPDEPGRFDTLGVTADDNGRVAVRSIVVPSIHVPVRIVGHLVIKPIPKDELVVHDKWDRAGSLRLAQSDGPDVELIKFMTAYGGRTEYTVDLSHLAPLLSGELTFKVFIDTWVSPAWQVDFSLSYDANYKDSTNNPQREPVWAQGIFLEDGFKAETYGDSGITLPVTVPSGAQRTLLHYFVSGHCTDGRDEDEFVPKDNVISVDGVVVHRFRPWRDDCGDFRAVNPYTRRWSDGWWSSDYSRSGWCPGDMVAPLELDLSDHLTPGEHTVTIAIENIRPADTAGHHGYWRVSAQLLGVTDIDTDEID